MSQDKFIWQLQELLNLLEEYSFIVDEGEESDENKRVSLRTIRKIIAQLNYNPVVHYDAGMPCLRNERLHIAKIATTGSFKPDDWEVIASGPGHLYRVLEDETMTLKSRHQLNHFFNFENDGKLIIEEEAVMSILLGDVINEGIIINDGLLIIDRDPANSQQPLPQRPLPPGD